MASSTLRKKKQTFSMLVIAADKYPPFRVDVTELFGEELSSRDHNIDWILQSEQNAPKDYLTSWKGGEVWVGACDNGSTRSARVKKHIKGIRNDLRLFKLLRERPYDFIQVKDKFLSAISAIIASKLTKTPFIFWLSYPFPEASRYEYQEGIARYPKFYLLRSIFLDFILYKLIAKHSKHIFVQSEQMKLDMVNRGIAAEKMSAVPMGISSKLIIDETLSDNERKTDAISEHIVTYIGTLDQQRKLDFTIRAFAKVCDAIPDALYYVVGDGNVPEERQQLQKLAKELKIANKVIFTGMLPQEEALKIVLNTNICLSPYYPTPILNSTSPTKLIEYMAMGKAVICNNHPEQLKVITESNAGLCTPWDEDAFAQAMIELLNDPDKQQHMGRNGIAYVKKHRTYEKIADGVEQQYLVLLEQANEKS